MVKVGDEVEAVVLTLDRESKKMSLGIKQLTGDPWAGTEILEKYAVDTKHQGVVRNMTHFGAFLELEEGIDGLLHVSDLSWTQKVNHPSEVLKAGDSVEVVVLELDKENKRLALGRKQLEDNPWDAYEQEFALDSVHKATIAKKLDKGALVELPHDIEGFIPKRHLMKEDGQEAEVGEELELKVIEFSKNSKKIMLSHTATFSEVKEHASKTRTGGKQSGAGNFIASEKSTLGDIEALANLKEQIDEDAARTE